MALLWRSDSNFLELVLPFCHVGSENWTWDITLSGKHLYPLSYLAGLVIVFLNIILFVWFQPASADLPVEGIFWGHLQRIPQCIFHGIGTLPLIITLSFVFVALGIEPRTLHMLGCVLLPSCISSLPFQDNFYFKSCRLGLSFRIFLAQSHEKPRL